MEDNNDFSEALQAQFEAQLKSQSFEKTVEPPKLVIKPKWDDSYFDFLEPEKIDFPPGLPEEFRVQVCKLFDDKNKEIYKLQGEIDKLEAKYNGALSYHQGEELKDTANRANYLVEAISRELENRNLRAIKYEPQDYPIRPFDIKIIRIPWFERFKQFMNKLIPFEIKMKNNK